MKAQHERQIEGPGLWAPGLADKKPMRWLPPAICCYWLPLTYQQHGSKPPQHAAPAAQHADAAQTVVEARTAVAAPLSLRIIDFMIELRNMKNDENQMEYDEITVPVRNASGERHGRDGRDGSLSGSW
jgi:hypothetical protein